MKTALFASTAALLLAAAPLAQAQQQPPDQPGAEQAQPQAQSQDQPPAAGEQPQAQPGQEPQRQLTLSAGPPEMSAEELSGKEVLARDGNRVGEIDDVRLSPDGKVEAVVISRGGFLGVGEERVAIDWNQIRTSQDGDLVANMTESEVAELPAAE